MQQVHRTTLWRRKRKAKAKGRSDRRLKGGKEDSYNLNLLAKLLRAYWASFEAQAPGGGISMSVAKTMPEDMAFSVLRNLLLGGSPYPVGALVAAVWDRLTPETQRRTNKARGRGVSIKRNQKLQTFIAQNAGLPNAKETYAIENAAIAVLVRSGHSKASARKLVEGASPRGEGWVREFAERGNAGTTISPSHRPACASRWFKITPRMLSYYRRTYDCGQMADDICGRIEKAFLDSLMAKAARRLVRSSTRTAPA
jgi:hypothetical protein